MGIVLIFCCLHPIYSNISDQHAYSVTYKERPAKMLYIKLSRVEFDFETMKKKKSGTFVQGIMLYE